MGPRALYKDLSSVLRQISDRLPEYLHSQGVRNTNHLFSCINPAHADDNPSCGIVPASHNTVFHCFSCHAVGSTIKAAHFLEGKPVVGAGFILTVKELAERFGIPMPEIEVTPEQLRDMNLINLHADAARIVATAPLSVQVQERIETFYKWPDLLRKSLGIGGVTSFDWYMHLMTVQNGYSRELMRELGLDDRRIFNENCLIYTVKDEKGNAVGFAARNLTHKARVEEKKALVEKHGKDAEEVKTFYVPPKFVNSRDTDHDTGAARNTIYKKGTRLFGINVAQRECRDKDLPLWVFEGYGDCATAHAHGFTNTCAIGATAFTPEHLQLILGLQIKHVIFVLDADAAGEEATNRLIKTIEEQVGGQVGFRCEVVAMPEGSDDPDAFIREHSVDAFKAIPRLSLFEWRLSQELCGVDSDRERVVARMVKLIINEPASTRRHTMARRLAEKTDYPLEVVWSEVTREMDGEKLKLQEQKTVLSARYAARLAQHPENPEVVVHEMQNALAALGSRYMGYRPGISAAHMEHVRDMQEKTKKVGGLKLGWPIFDDKFGGIPTDAKFVSFPGGPNCGKSSAFWNIAWRVVEHNEDAVCLVHSVDDTLEELTPRLLGSKYSVPGEYFKCAGFHLEQNPKFRDLYHEAWGWLNTRIAEERLILVDMKDISKDLAALDLWVKQISSRFSGRPIVILADNFHHYDVSSQQKETGASKQAIISRAAKDIANAHDVGLLMTMELPKEALTPGMRPRFTNLKGSGGMSYDVSANVGVYNDMKNFGQQASLYWEDSNDTEEVPGPQGIILKRAIRKPIIELVFDKSKVHRGFAGEIYYKLDGASGRYDECTPAEQSYYAEIAQEQQRGMAQQSARRGNGRGWPQQNYTPPAPAVAYAPQVPAEVMTDFRSASEIFA